MNSSDLLSSRVVNHQTWASFKLFITIVDNLLSKTWMDVWGNMVKKEGSYKH